ncbi:hypothetical protein [Halomonas sp. G11]|uniref:hypothetical protein n=1 Tax=Halomonas sp. G11 TaxID=1684425 RepID=UPI0009EDDAC0|nr:hypothetical protein [Halomonas sp. G11]
MVKRYVINLGVLLVTASLPVWAQSPAEQRSLEAAGQVDVSKFFSSQTDARSRTFPFRGEQTHTFTVTDTGRYQLVSSPVGGDSDYRISASLTDEQGNVIRQEEAFGRNGGLEMTVELEPGEYTLATEARKMGSTNSGANGYLIQVAGLDASGNRVAQGASGIDDGDDAIFGQSGDSGSVFVRPGAASIALDSERQPDEPQATPDNASTTSSTEEADDAERAGASTPDTILADVRIAYEGEVVTFTLDEPSDVQIDSSTFPGNEGSYRLEARLLDAQGDVVAQDQGSAVAGDFSISERLAPGEYRVWVEGRRIGSIQGRDSTYQLRVEVMQ